MKSDRVSLCPIKTSLITPSFGGKHLDALTPNGAWESLFQPHNSLFVVQVWRMMMSRSVLLTKFKKRIIHCPACQRAGPLKLTQLDPLSHPIHSLHPSWSVVSCGLEERGGKHCWPYAHWKPGCIWDSTPTCAPTNGLCFVAYRITLIIWTQTSKMNKFNMFSVFSLFFFLWVQHGTCFKMRNIYQMYPNWSMRQCRWGEWNEILRAA